MSRTRVKLICHGCNTSDTLTLEEHLEMIRRKLKAVPRDQDQVYEYWCAFCRLDIDLGVHADP
jgi:hypothetical protein